MGVACPGPPRLAAGCAAPQTAGEGRADESQPAMWGVGWTSASAAWARAVASCAVSFSRAWDLLSLRSLSSFCRSWRRRSSPGGLVGEAAGGKADNVVVDISCLEEPEPEP